VGIYFGVIWAWFFSQAFFTFLLKTAYFLLWRINLLKNNQPVFIFVGRRHRPTNSIVNNYLFSLSFWLFNCRDKIDNCNSLQTFIFFNIYNVDWRDKLIWFFCFFLFFTKKLDNVINFPLFLLFLLQPPKYIIQFL